MHAQTELSAWRCLQAASCPGPEQQFAALDMRESAHSRWRSSNLTMLGKSHVYGNAVEVHAHFPC